MAYETDNNISKAIIDECEANRRYMFFADKAEEEGYPQVARMFRAIAEAESIHARNHFYAIDAIGTTRDNLTAASMIEHREFSGMYPFFIEKAKEEKNDRAELTFTRANAVEKGHHALFEAALAAIQDGQQPEDAEYYVCQVCGNTVTAKAPDKCPVCGAPGKVFIKVE
jgi:rubrerythrin